MIENEMNRRTALRLGAGGAAAAAAAPLLGATSAAAETAEAQAVATFRVGRATGKKITAADFSYNAPFHFTGLFHGTLPSDDPRSKRPDFAAALQESGVRSLRFPGGKAALLYLHDGESFTAELTRDLNQLNPSETAGRIYQPDRWSHKYYVKLDDFLDVCEENDVEPIYQLNTAFYRDLAEDRTWAIVPTRWVIRSDGTTVNEYYDRPRIQEAADALAAHVEALVAAGRSIRYWEIGNEEFSRYDVGRDALSPGNSDQEISYYAQVVVTFARVVKEQVPDAKILITGARNWQGNPWDVPLLNEIESLGGIDLVDFTTSHYPFSKENRPDTPDEPLSDFVTTDMNLTTHVGHTVQNNIDAGYPHVGVAVTETSVYRLPHWTGVDVTPTFAHGLVWSHGFGQLIFETPSPVNVKHDFESFFFGGLVYDTVLDPAVSASGKRNLHWIGPDGEYHLPLTTDEGDIPDENWFSEEYFLTPQMRMNALMSKAVGLDALVVNPGALNELVSVFAAIDESGKNPIVELFAVNRSAGESEATVEIDIPGIRAICKRVGVETLTASPEWGLAAIHPTEMNLTRTTASKGRSAGGVPTATCQLPAYSMSRLQLELIVR
ncbi:hypothetical protein [Ruania rhizosphaerae]|uniref:hypothetical protein n=1 Tax=Ruania rhizosphaerae TaxID=1840413 RepID=UPI00135ACE85|nr:hypothetical protein [Ruania rhizosphaerae]